MNSLTQGVSLSPDCEREHEKKRKHYVDKLQEFPHSFQMTDLLNKSKNSVERIKEGLIEALKVGFKTPLETARARNLLSYCFFFLGNLTEAKKQSDKSRALDDQQTNIVSLANNAFILIYMDYYDRAQEKILVLQELKKQTDFPYLVTKAKGELAFSYTRMGPPFFPQATRLFKEILPNARGEEELLWEFGLALTYRRTMHIQNIEVIAAIDNQEHRSLSEMTLNLLKDILRRSKSKNLKAKAYSELALLLNQNRTNTRFNQEAGISTEEACNKALELDKDDYSVLVKTGRIFRYLKLTERSCQLLETAVSIRPSSTAFHHLGLTYKALATATVYQCSTSGRRGRGSLRRTGDRERGGGRRGRGGRGRMLEETWSGQKSDEMRHDWTGVYARGSDSMVVRQNSDVVYYGSGRAGQPGNWRGTSEFTRRRSADYRQSRSKSDTHDKYYAQKQELFCYSSLLGAERATAHSREETAIKGDDCSLNAAFDRMSLDSVDPNSHGGLTQNVSHSEANKFDETLTQRELKKMVKTPDGNETKFSRSDPYIPKALHYLEESIKFSKDENTRAVYDLALLHKALGEYDNALDLLLEIRNNKSMMIGAFDKVNAWEQTGLILKTMSKNETNEEEKKKLDNEGETMLRTALHEAMRLFSRAPSIQPQVCHVWHSFSTLLADIEKSDGNTREKIREKARLLTLVSKHKESISLLQELKSLSPQNENDPETLKILIENYAETEEYESAAFIIDLLKCSSQGTPTLSLFGDKYYTQKVYIKAAKQHLMASCAEPKSSSAELARRFFLAAFKDVVSDVFHVGGSSASSCCSSDTWETSSSSDSKDIEGWHVMLLYDDRDNNMEVHANCLKSLLNQACSLNVTCMTDDIMPGMIIEELLRNMKKSHLLVFIVGEKKISRNLKYLISNAVERRSTVTLLVNTTKVPRMLFPHNSMSFPPELLDFKVGVHTQRTAETICSLFRFLIGIEQGVSLSPDCEREHEKKRKHYVDKLQEFPHSFQMTDLLNKSKNSFERIKEGLIEALKVGFKTALETARARNLLSYCLFFLGYPTEAIEEIDRARALEDQQTNIVSLANKAFIWIHIDYYDRAQEQIVFLQKLKTQTDFPYLVTKAKGELAFSYTRMGPLLSPQATRLFKEILPNARGEEEFLWEFGLALTYRRAMHIQNIEVIAAIDNQEGRQLNGMTLDLLKDILRRSKSKNLQAKAYSEIALLLNQNRENTRFNLEAGISPEEACDKALELDERDYSVLVKTGRIFRYLKETERSCQLLETAVSIRPSSTAFHHLGLTYKALATATIYQCSTSGRRGRGSLSGTGERGRGGRGRMSEERRISQISDEIRHDWTCASDRGSDSMVVRQNSDVVYYGSGRAGRPGNWRGTCEFTRRRSADYSQSGRGSDTHDKYHAQKQELFCSSSLLGAERATAHSREETAIKGDDCSLNAAFDRMSLDSVDPNSHGGLTQNVSSTEANKVDETLTQRELKKMVKTPKGNETKFSRSDPYIPKALHYLEESIKFSKDENARAVYDLALLHKALGEYDKALNLLLKIRNNKSLMIGAFDKVNAWEQTGLILKTMSKNESNEEEKKKLDNEGETMLRTALHEAMRLFSRTPSIQQQVCHVWHSFSTLLEDIEKSDGNTREKVREKARLLTLVSKHKESISLLQELKSISPQNENDPETLKILIENYAETEEYESAAIFIDLLKCSSQGTPTLSLFADNYYTQKVYIKAAEQHLMTSCDKLEPTFDLARRFFLAAFTDVVSESSASSESGESSSSSDSDEADEWHVMLLYDDGDEDMERYANSLKSLLGDACGLGVTCMYDDVMPGMKRDGLLRNMKKSQLLVFIAGEKISRNLKYFMEIAAERELTIILLVNTQKVPRLLSKRRNRPFPTEFLDFTAGTYTPETAGAVCSLFRFLIGIGEG